MTGAVERGVRKSLRKLEPEVRSGGLAVLAVQLARQVDARPDSPTLAQVSKVLHGVLTDLAKFEPVVARSDEVDDLAGRRQARRAAG